MAIICVGEQHWKSLLDAMDRNRTCSMIRALRTSSRASPTWMWSTSWSAVHRKVHRHDLFALLDTHRVPAAPVRALMEVVNDPHLLSAACCNGSIIPVRPRSCRTTDALRRYGAAGHEPSRSLGEDNDETYGGWLGLSATDIAALRADGVI